VTAGVASEAVQNIWTTYLHLAEGIAGVRIERSEGFILCRGQIPHPVCNFAIVLEPEVDVFRALSRHCRGCQVNVYVTSVGSVDPREALIAQGFAKAYELEILVAPVQAPPDRYLEVATVAVERRQSVARFMMDCFFACQGSHLRRSIANAIARSEDLELLGLGRGSNSVAAAMLSSSPAMLGLYNLCVAEPLRGQGIGREVVSACLATAWARKLPLTLQCQPTLSTWYEDQGFERCGKLEVFSPTAGNGVIMMQGC